MAFAGLPAGQAVFVAVVTRPVEAIAGLVGVAGMLCSGIVSCRFTAIPGLKDMLCRAERLTSTEAPPEGVLVVTTPCRTAGEGAPTSATIGMAFKFVPFGTFTIDVAL